MSFTAAARVLSVGGLALALPALTACTGGGGTVAPTASTSAPASPGAVDVAGLEAAMKTGKVVLYDVRTPGEYAGGHVPGAVNIPLDQLSSRMDELAPHKGDAVYLVCASGNRSGKAATQLAAAGFSNPINVEGGTRAWQAAGKPLE